MPTAPASDGVPSPVYKDWQYWRGSPALVAHLARVCVQSVEEQTGERATCLIAVTVGEDSETFATPEAFLATVTPEAINCFSWIAIAARNDALAAQLSFARRMRGTTVLTGKGSALSWRISDGVSLVVRALRDGNEKQVNAVLVAVAAAVRRGSVKTSRLVLLFGGAMVGLAAALQSTIFLLGPHSWIAQSWHGGLVGLLIVMFALPFIGWVWPQVEIAEVGRTRLARVTRIVAGLLGSIIVAGLLKWLFHSSG